jgi:starch synthase
MTGLGWELFTPEGLEFHGQLNMMKAGLVWADVISTVSRKYASEALTPEYAFGLEGVLKVRKDDTYAVLNGVDYDVWDPSADQDIKAGYSPGDLSGKKECRRDLAQAFKLNDDDHPIVAVISRLLDRKGFDILSAGISDILALDLKMVFMGMGEDKYHSLLNDLARDYPGRVGIKVAYDKALAHRIMAGADMFLMPSRYEPCGLEQLYALKFATVPVVRATGGLDDTVIDVTKHPDKGTGFKFGDYTPQALLQTIETALLSFNDKSAWEDIMRRGMSCDFSWSRAATEYEKIYLAAKKKIGGA